MTEGLERLVFLVDTTLRESRHLGLTDERLFASPFSVERVVALHDDVAAAEQCDAFVARFGRLQDTAGDKLLPELLRQLAEPVGPAVDNLDRAEKFGLLASADDWLQARKLRNRMGHEYVRDPELLADALNAGHAGVPLLQDFTRRVAALCRSRWPVDFPAV